MPYPDACQRAQGFGRNSNPFYKANGLLGHTGDDEHCGYGSDVHSAPEGLVISTYTPEKPASDGYTAVYILVETAYELFEFTIGHLSEVLVEVGERVKRGDLIGREGNKGVVYQGNERITLAMQAAGDKRGSHRHYQCRPVRDVRKRTLPNRYYLRNADGFIKGPQGGFLEHALPDNGFAGCVDFGGIVFTYNFGSGHKSYEVLLLQRILGLGEELQTGYFGKNTAEALQVFQRLHYIPDTGYCGLYTRTVLNSLYARDQAPTASVAAELSDVTSVLEHVPTMPVPNQADALALLLDWVHRLWNRLRP